MLLLTMCVTLVGTMLSVGSQYQEGGVGELKLLTEETIKGDYQVIT